MSITVRYFASLKETVGRSVDAFLADTALTPEQVWQQLNPQLALPANVLIAVNMEYVDRNSLVKDGDELAFFPAVTGG